jgi:hypothetical protein
MPGDTPRGDSAFLQSVSFALAMLHGYLVSTTSIPHSSLSVRAQGLECRHRAAGQDTAAIGKVSPLVFVGQTRASLLCKSADARSSLRQRQLGYLRLMREGRKSRSI